VTASAKSPRLNPRPVAYEVFGVFLLMLLLLFPTPVPAHEEEIDFGQSAAGELKAHIEFDQPFPLPHSIYPGVSGYATAEMGLHSTPLDEPTNDFFQLSSSADFRLILLSKDPGIEVWNDHGTAFMTNGESFYLGVPFFDSHPMWNIVSGTTGTVYSISFKLHDVNGVYADSDPVTISFTPIAPATLSIQDNPDSTITITMQGTADAEYIFQRTTNLLSPTNWIIVATNIAGEDGSATFTESKLGSAQRFYRCINH